MRVERLQNGYVRVDTKSGLVHLWEMVPGLTGPMVQRRHGDGISELGEVEAVWSAFNVPRHPSQRAQDLAFLAWARNVTLDELEERTS